MIKPEEDLFQGRDPEKVREDYEKITYAIVCLGFGVFAFSLIYFGLDHFFRLTSTLPS